MLEGLQYPVNIFTRDIRVHNRGACPDGRSRLLKLEDGDVVLSQARKHVKVWPVEDRFCRRRVPRVEHGIFEIVMWLTQGGLGPVERSAGMDFGEGAAREAAPPSRGSYDGRYYSLSSPLEGRRGSLRES